MESTKSTLGVKLSMFSLGSNPCGPGPCTFGFQCREHLYSVHCLTVLYTVQHDSKWEREEQQIKFSVPIVEHTSRTECPTLPNTLRGEGGGGEEET